MLTMTILLGLPGAGKSTYTANRYHSPKPDRLIITMDTLRRAWGYRYAEHIEVDVLMLTLAMAHYALKTGRNVIIDESVTSLTPAYALAAMAHKHGAAVEMVEIVTSPETCWKRREPTGFPRQSFERKLRQWRDNRDTILALADRHIQISMEDDPETREAPAHIAD